MQRKILAHATGKELDIVIGTKKNEYFTQDGIPHSGVKHTILRLKVLSN